MTGIARVLGRLIAVLVDIEIINLNQAVWILEPLKTLKDKAESEPRESEE